MGHERKAMRIGRSSHASCLVAHAFFSERMRAVRADGELQLEEKLVDRLQVAVLRVAQLAADLAEFRGPEGERRRDALVDAERLEGLGARLVVGAVETHAGEPALTELIVERRVEAA